MLRLEFFLCRKERCNPFIGISKNMFEKNSRNLLTADEYACLQRRRTIHNFWHILNLQNVIKFPSFPRFAVPRVCQDSWPMHLAHYNPLKTQLWNEDADDPQMIKGNQVLILLFSWTAGRRWSVSMNKPGLVIVIVDHNFGPWGFNWDPLVACSLVAWEPHVRHGVSTVADAWCDWGPKFGWSTWLT